MLGKDHGKDRMKELEEEAERLRRELAEKDKTIAALTQKLDAVKAFVWKGKEEAEAALGSVQQAMADTQEAIKKLGAAGPMPQETHSVSKA